MANAVVGRVLLISKGDYSASATYKMLDWVRHDNKAWVCKQESIGNAPQDGTYWQLLAQDGADGGYCYIRYSASADGTGFVANPTGSTIYIGFYTGDSDTAPTSKADYTWSRYVGAKGDKGDKGDTGAQGVQGIQGVKGDSGNLNYYGTLITGNSTTPTVYATGIEYANIGDSYTNTTTFFEYRCVLAGEEVVAKWVYVGSKKGADGLGSGDMNKATYDVNNNGIVDNAEKLGGKLPSHYLYSLPIGGTNLGGVKNGGNVTIDEDGEMNAEVGAGDMLASVYATNGTTGVVDTSNRLRKYTATNPETTYVNQWTKIATLTFETPYNNACVIFSAMYRAEVYGAGVFSLRVRVGASASTHESATLYCISADKNFKPRVGTIKIVHTAPKYEVWFNPTDRYLTLNISILNEAYAGVGFTWLENQPYQATQPAGTVVTATLMEDYLITDLTAETTIADTDYFMMHDTSAVANKKTLWSSIKSTLKTYFDTLYNKTASTTVKGGIKIGDGLTISNEVLSANVKGLINNKTDFDAQTVSTSQAVNSLLVKELLDDIDVSGGGGAGNVINITTQETSLFMREITATSENGEIATAKFNMVGQATLYAPFTGLITLSASNASGTEDSTIKIMSYNFKDFDVEMKLNELYGFCVDTTNNSPSGAVTYLAGYDNEFYTPAKMNYVTGVFDYGSWKSAFFLRESRWVMLKSDGTIDYDLDREDHAKKASDGSASDVGNEAYDGNAMFACVNSYIKFWQEEGDLTKLYFAVSKKPLVGFQNYAHHDNNGNTMPYTFIRMFDGTLVSGKLRSLANNATPLNNVTGTAEIGYAQANGDYWYTGLYNDRVLINNLLLLMGKSRDTQTVFGNGHYTGGSSAANYIKTGTMVDKGLFYGTNSTGVGVKVFGIENWWGNRWERIGGYMYVSNLQQVKLTYGTEDGSTTTGYNTTGSGYIAIPNSTIGGTAGGYTSVVSFYDKGFVPKTVSGSQSTHWCDGCWSANNAYAFVGGRCDTGFLVGAFCVNLADAVSGAVWGIGASVSCKPPVN